MIFKIKNLGIIDEAEVDLSKDLILLTGQNNTGKTYLAYSIYGFFEYFLQHEFILKVIPTLDLDNVLNELFDKKKIEIDLYNLFIQNNKKIFKNFSNMYLEQLNKVLGSDKSFISKTKFSIYPKDIKKTNLKNYFIQYTEQLRRGSPEINYELIKNENSDKFLIEIFHIDNSKSEAKRIIVDTIERFFISMLWRYFFTKQIFMFPAERIAINVFSKDLSLKRIKLIEELSRSTDPKSLIERQTSRYPLPILNNLIISEDLDALQKNISTYNYIADEIEILLNGKINISEYGQMKFNPDNNGNVNLDIHLTGSSVKSLAGLVFYFRHLAKEGDYIIIDEPELTLHPDNQKKIARIIATMINAGFKVIASTHSDYIIKEINNLIMLSKEVKNKDELLKKYGYKKNELLKPEQVEALLFKVGNRKPEKINITETGFTVETIDTVIESLDTETEDIYFQIFEKAQ